MKLSNGLCQGYVLALLLFSLYIYCGHAGDRVKKMTMSLFLNHGEDSGMKPFQLMPKTYNA
nr:unnamed protein product [Callosobruchus chinensis]